MTEAWLRTTLGQVAHVRQGRGLTLAELEAGDHPVYGANGVIGRHREGTTDVEVVAVGSRGSCGSVHRAPAGSFLTKNVIAIRPRDDELTSLDFLALAIEGTDLVSNGVITGQGLPQITTRALARLPILLPPPRDQGRIVDVMARLDACRSLLRDERDRIVALRRAWYLRGTEGCRATAPLADLADVRLGRAMPPGIRGMRTGDTPWFRISDMGSDANAFGYRDAATWATRAAIADLRGEVHPVGTVVFPRVGAAVLTERKRLMEVPGAVDQNHLALVPDGRSDPEYLLAFLECTHLADHVQNGAVPSLSLRLGRAIRVPALSLARQRRLSAVLAPLRLTAAALSREARALEAIRGALLPGLVSGRRALPGSLDELEGHGA